MIQFILNNQIIKTFEKKGVTLLDFNRHNKQLKVIKNGYREGNYSICILLVRELKDKQIAFKTIIQQNLNLLHKVLLFL